MSIKNIKIIGLLLLISSKLFAQGSYTINGTVTSEQDLQIAYLYIFDQGIKKIDSAVISDGKFQFQGEIDKAWPASIRIPNNRRSLDLILEPGIFKVVMNSDWKQPQQVFGGVENTIRKAFEADTKSQQDSMIAISRLYEHADEAKRILLGNKLQAINQEAQLFKDSYLQTYPTSVAVLEWIKIGFPRMNYRELKSLSEQLSPTLAYLPSYQELQKQLTLKQSQFIVGNPAPAINSTTDKGKPFKLSDYKGKLVLLDFWASWCTPCRAANKKLIPIYEQYKDKGFEIISFSMDDKERLWKQAIKHDGIPWVQASDLSDLGSSQVAKDYSVSQLPTIYLIDEKGVIIDQNIGIEQLTELLEQRYNN